MTDLHTQDRKPAGRPKGPHTKRFTVSFTPKAYLLFVKVAGT